MNTQLITSLKKLQSIVHNHKISQKSIGLVPTMGALHPGHLSLIKKSLSQNDLTIVSIFVNPTQFGPQEDYHQYPRTLIKDRALLDSFSAPLIIFHPAIDTLYPLAKPYQIQISLPTLSHILCGASRTNLFAGVLQIVLKLFHICLPDKAYFGEKDFQQLTLIKLLVKDTLLPIKIISCPIIRTNDGLALSSRNQYLSPEERTTAPIIFQTLTIGQKIFLQGETNSSKIISEMQKVLATCPLLNIEYLTIVDPNTLETKNIAQKKDRLLFAGLLGQTRLIDNAALGI
jgi:pantoate--beta-alanine ligase